MKDRFFGHHTIITDGEPYMTRLWFGRLRLHIFHRGDVDPDCHDHPWNFLTFPLTSYVEEVLVHKGCNWYSEPIYEKQLIVVPAFWFSYRKATHCHRVLGRYSGLECWDWPGRVKGEQPIPLTRDGKVVTVVWRGRENRKWGFLKNRDGQWCWTPWKKYVLEGGKDAPCKENE